MRVDALGEWGLIERLRQYAAPEGMGFRDDCAVIQAGGGAQMLVTTDALVGGVHFDPALMSWRDIGYRSLAASISDLASSGACGEARYVVALGVPGQLRVEEIEEIYAGMADLGEQTGAGLIGGDTVESAVPFISITAFAPVERPLLRGAAEIGHQVYVSGTLGASAAGLQRLLRGEPPEQAQRFLRPLPRVALGAALARLGAGACDDVSDGLFPELQAIAKASGVGIRIDESALPLEPGVPRDEALRYAYDGGEDFELLFTAGPDFDLAAAAKSGVRLCRIGEVTQAASGLEVRREGRLEPLVGRGYQHFSGGDA
ncbi:MAG: thiamine-phosphate kinase [Thermaerobacter sp.]|nr:thiamine-phosphate kinase [Thermaerobacter sp.]